MIADSVRCAGKRVLNPLFCFETMNVGERESIELEMADLDRHSRSANARGKNTHTQTQPCFRLCRISNKARSVARQSRPPVPTPAAGAERVVTPFPRSGRIKVRGSKAVGRRPAFTLLFALLSPGERYSGRDRGRYRGSAPPRSHGSNSEDPSFPRQTVIHGLFSSCNKVATSFPTNDSVLLDDRQPAHLRLPPAFFTGPAPPPPYALTAPNEACHHETTSNDITPCATPATDSTVTPCFANNSGKPKLINGSALSSTDDATPW